MYAFVGLSVEHVRVFTGPNALASGRVYVHNQGIHERTRHEHTRAILPSTTFAGVLWALYASDGKEIRKICSAYMYVHLYFV